MFKTLVAIVTGVLFFGHGIIANDVSISAHHRAFCGLIGMLSGGCGKLESLGGIGVGLSTQFLCCALNPTTAKNNNFLHMPAL
jgi:hypothetical protein